MRPGQIKAHNTILSRFIEGHPFTSIIQPTRYGKSDIIRCSALALFQKQQIAMALVASPNELLRDQIVNKDKLSDWLARYAIRRKGIKTGKLCRLPKGALNPNGEFLVSTTIQLLQRNVDIFGEHIIYLRDETGLPTVVYVDESHLTSEDNHWGGAIETLVKDYGVRAVVLTATALRADGKVPPGFYLCRDDGDEKTVVKTFPSDNDPKLIRVEIYNGVERLIKVTADCETTFKEAWSEIPSPLCQIDYFPFDVILGELACVNPDDMSLLSELSPSATRSILGKVVRDSKVIRKGVELFCEGLNGFRKLATSTQGIVFCGNDSATDNETNEHAKCIKLAIEGVDQSLRICIATSADGEGKKILESFGSGNYDVAIVKQMASVGLDIASMKVGLDLSTIRTIPAMCQRDNRTTTKWGSFKYALKIGPADCLSAEIFRNFVSNEGGGKIITDLELRHAYEIEPDSEDKPVLQVHGTIGAPFRDTENNEAESKYHEDARRLFNMFPQLQESVSRAQAVLTFREHGVSFTAPQAPDDDVVDVDSLLHPLRNEINTLSKAIVKTRIGGYDGSADKKIQYGECARQVMREAKINAGVDPNIELGDIRSIDDMARLRDQFILMSREV